MTPINISYRITLEMTFTERELFWLMWVAIMRFIKRELLFVMRNGKKVHIVTR